MSVRLGVWLGLVGALVALAYGSRAAEGKPPENIIYHYGFAAAGLIEYAILLGLVLAIAGRDRVRLLALRPPVSWARALGLAILVLAAVIALGQVLEQLLDPSGEQGLTPKGWDGSRAGAFAVNFVVIAGVGPIVEELMFRGLGYSLLERFGTGTAIAAVGVTFGLVHGLVDGLPILVVLGAGLAYLRSRTTSVYPPVLLHSVFNAIALIAAVTT